MKKLILSLIFASFLSSCGPREIKRYSIGKINYAREIENSFNAGSRTSIYTDRYYVSVKDIISVPLGTEGFLIEYDDGDKRFYWAGGQFSYNCY